MSKLNDFADVLRTLGEDPERTPTHLICKEGECGQTAIEHRPLGGSFRLEVSCKLDNGDLYESLAQALEDVQYEAARLLSIVQHHI